MEQDPQSLKHLMSKVLQENKLSKGIEKLEVEQTWLQVMGEGVQSYTHSVKFSEHTLFVQLTSSVLREELSYGKEKIIKMINEHLKKDLVKRVVLK